MNTTSAGYMSAEDLHKITAKDRDDAPIGLFPQLFELYNWLQKSNTWNYFGDEIIIPDKISWKNYDKGAWVIQKVFSMNKRNNIMLRLDFRSPKIGEFHMRISVAVADKWFDEESSSELINYEFISTKKNGLDFILIEKRMEECQKFYDEMDQIYNDKQRAYDEILGRYK